jgi:hypothetical protein
MNARERADHHAVNAEKILSQAAKQPGNEAINISAVALLSMASSLLAIRAELKAFREAQTGVPINQVKS